jgi:hypothetical protein
MDSTTTFPAGITPGSTVTLLERSTDFDIRRTVTKITRDPDGGIIALSTITGLIYTPNEYELVEVEKLAYYGRPVATGRYTLHTPAVWGGAVYRKLQLHEDGTWEVTSNPNLVEHLQLNDNDEVETSSRGTGTRGPSSPSHPTTGSSAAATPPRTSRRRSTPSWRRASSSARR